MNRPRNEHEIEFAAFIKEERKKLDRFPWVGWIIFLTGISLLDYIF